VTAPAARRSSDGASRRSLWVGERTGNLYSAMSSSIPVVAAAITYARHGARGFALRPPNRAPAQGLKDQMPVLTTFDPSAIALIKGTESGRICRGGSPKSFVQRWSVEKRARQDHVAHMDKKALVANGCPNG
jgi:hypothetical protein